MAAGETRPDDLGYDQLANSEDSSTRQRDAIVGGSKQRVSSKGHRIRLVFTADWKPEETRKLVSRLGRPKVPRVRSSSGSETGTSGQFSTASATTEPDTCNILAITTGRGDARGEVGMAVIDVRYPHMILCQISDCHTYANTLSKILAMQPIEIIIPDTMGERSIYSSGLYRAIRDKFGAISITEVARMHFHDSAGLDRIRTHVAEEFASVELYVRQKYYALAAAAALLKYVEFIQHIVYAPKSMRIDFHGSQNSAMIDIESAQNLELVTSQGGPSNFSLLGSLDRCCTPMGRRLLRVSILQPPCDLEMIQSRQACVAEFVSNRSLHSIVQPVIKRLYGTSRLLSLAMLTSQADSVMAAERNLNYILLLKNIIEIVPELDSVLSTTQAPFFRKVSESLKDPRYQTMREQILSIVHSEARSVMGFTSSNMQRCFAIRSGISEMLDVARQAYCELIDDMQNLVDKLSTKYNLPLSLGCNPKLGYHIEMDAPRRANSSRTDFPAELIEVHQLKNTVFMTTEYLMVLSQHCKEACQELHLMSNVLLNETLTKIRDHIGCLLRLSDDVAELDIVSSLAQVSAIPDFVRPTFGSRLELRNSRHPVMDTWGVDCSRAPVPNDVSASLFRNFHTITGPNMSGKSVYLKQIVLLQIMAQIGCYVPATAAEFRITDRIFCRMCSRDDVEAEGSTFVLEIKEIQYILQSITPTSLVILDELCRGTTVEEGTSIAWAISERLIRHSRAFVFSATHFLYLTRLAELYSNVTNHYFETESTIPSPSSDDSTRGDARLNYTHKLVQGIANVWNYGIALARSTGMRREIVNRAQKFASEIAKSVTPEAKIARTDRASSNVRYEFVAGLVELLERQRLTVENIAELAREKNLPIAKFVERKNAIANEPKPGQTSDSTATRVPTPKIHEPRFTLKRQLSAGNFSPSRETKKPRQPEDSRSLLRELQSRANEAKTSGRYFPSPAKEAKMSQRFLPSPATSLKYSGAVDSQILLQQLQSLERETQMSVRYSPSPAISVRNFRAFEIPNSPAAVSLASSDRRRGRAISVQRASQQSSISPTSRTTNGRSWKSVVEEATDAASQSGFCSAISSTETVISEESIATPVARITARKKEEDIFRIIEGKTFDENSFYHSFMKPNISLESSEKD